MSRLQHKRGRKSDYTASLNTAEWKQVRQRVIARDRSCKVCSSILYLEVHHVAYNKNGISIRGKEGENLDCLVLLCGECHQKAHKEKTHKYHPIYTL